MRYGCAPTFTSRFVITNRGVKPGAESSALKAKMAAGKIMRRRNLIAFMKRRENAPNEAIGNLDRLCGGHRCQSEIDRTKPNAEIVIDQAAPNEAIGKMVGLHGLSLDTRNAPHEANSTWIGYAGS
jgi:hypothetical protein